MNSTQSKLHVVMWSVIAIIVVYITINARSNMPTREFEKTEYNAVSP